MVGEETVPVSTLFFTFLLSQMRRQNSDVYTVNMKLELAAGYFSLA